MEKAWSKLPKPGQSICAAQKFNPILHKHKPTRSFKSPPQPIKNAHDTWNGGILYPVPSPSPATNRRQCPPFPIAYRNPSDRWLTENREYQSKEEDTENFIISDQEDSLASGPWIDASIRASPAPIAEDFPYYPVAGHHKWENTEAEQDFWQTKLSEISLSLSL